MLSLLKAKMCAQTCVGHQKVQSFGTIQFSTILHCICGCIIHYGTYIYSIVYGPAPCSGHKKVRLISVSQYCSRIFVSRYHSLYYCVGFQDLPLGLKYLMIEPQANLRSLVVSAVIYAGLGPAAGVLIKISLSLISFMFETI